MNFTSKSPWILLLLSWISFQALYFPLFVLYHSSWSQLNVREKGAVENSSVTYLPTSRITVCSLHSSCYSEHINNWGFQLLVYYLKSTTVLPKDHTSYDYSLLSVSRIPGQHILERQDTNVYQFWLSPSVLLEKVSPFWFMWVRLHHLERLSQPMESLPGTQTNPTTILPLTRSRPGYTWRIRPTE